MTNTVDFNINGVLQSTNSCMQNLEKLCTACGAWITFDIVEGKWSVIIKKEGTSKMSFNDTNILGPISVSSTGVTDLYNKTTITYPHVDMRDKTDQIDLEIPTADRYPYEIDNLLNIQTDLVTNPIQAEYLAAIELKQNRLDTVVQFTSDFTAMGLKAGDLITLTNTAYGFSNKLFRIQRVEQDDSESFIVNITALEYDANVYNSSGLTYTKRDIKTGIIPKSANTVLTTKDNVAAASAVASGLASDALVASQFQNAMNTNGIMFTAGGVSLAETPMSAGLQYGDRLPFYDFTFKVAKTGYNLLRFNINIQGAVCNGSRGPDFSEQTDYIKVFVEIIDTTTNTTLGNQYSGGMGAQSWTDFVIDWSDTLDVTHTYKAKIEYVYYSPEKKAIREAASLPTTMDMSITWNGFGYVAYTDSTGSNPPPSSNFSITPDWMKVKVSYPLPARDLDVKATVISPYINQSRPVGIMNSPAGGGAVVNYNTFPETGTGIIFHGGDDAYESPGWESILVNTAQLRSDYPNERFIIVQLNAIWGTSGSPPTPHKGYPIKIDSWMWKGATAPLVGHDYVIPSGVATDYCGTQTTGDYVKAYYTQDPYGIQTGQFFCYVIIDLQQSIFAITSSLPNV